MHAIHMIDTQVAVNVAANVATITRTKTNKNVVFENLLNRQSLYLSIINYSTLFSAIKFTKHRKVQLVTMDSYDSNEKIYLMALC